MKITKLIDEKTFKKMNKMRRRVAIAKDVLMRIQKGNIKPYSGKFFLNDDNKKGDKKQINKGGCAVCAKGAICASWIGNFNKYNLSNFLESDYPEELSLVFGNKLLSAVETLFEIDRFSWNDRFLTPDEMWFLVDWANANFSDLSVEKRLFAIMENLIKNKGALVLNFYGLKLEIK